MFMELLLELDELDEVDADADADAALWPSNVSNPRVSLELAGGRRPSGSH